MQHKVRPSASGGNAPKSPRSTDGSGPSNPKVVFWPLLLLATFVITELALLVLSYLVKRSVTGYDYAPPSPTQFEEYIARTRANGNDVVGWGPDPDAITAAGSRKSPNNTGDAPPCVSLYGDSFTWADGVTNEQAWGNQLAGLLECDVANFGVSGFGTDQAFIRFSRNESDDARTLILSHWAENIVRNINQDRTMIYGQGILLKPRFILVDGELQLVEIPRLNPEDYPVYVKNPEDILLQEYFLPGASSLSKQRLGFPYIVSMFRYLRSKRLYSNIASIWLNTPPWYASLYDPAFESDALSVSREIISEFVKLAAERNKTAFVFILPSIREMNVYSATGRWVYQPLLDELQHKGVQVNNIGLFVAERVNMGEDLCEYLCSDLRYRTGHYTPKGNRLLAEIAFDILDRSRSN